jgi:hypothetical protein
MRFLEPLVAKHVPVTWADAIQLAGMTCLYCQLLSSSLCSLACSQPFTLLASQMPTCHYLSRLVTYPLPTGAAAVELAGGPCIPMRYGRLDSPQAATEGNLPDATPPNPGQHVRDVGLKLARAQLDCLVTTGIGVLSDGV